MLPACLPARPPTYLPTNPPDRLPACPPAYLPVRLPESVPREDDGAHLARAEPAARGLAFGPQHGVEDGQQECRVRRHLRGQGAIIRHRAASMGGSPELGAAWGILWR